MDYLSLIRSKVIDRQQLHPMLVRWKLKDQKIVFTNGCFDLLHRGHVEYLARAASMGDILLIGLNSDSSVRKLKGASRPLQDEYSRALLIASFRFVTGVTLFEEETPYNLISLIRPDVLVKGGDYKEEDIVGADIVRKSGGSVVSVDFTQGYSSTSLIEKIRQSQ